MFISNKDTNSFKSHEKMGFLLLSLTSTYCYMDTSRDCTHASAGHAAASLAVVELAVGSVADDSVTVMMMDSRNRFDSVTRPIQADTKNYTTENYAIDSYRIHYL